MTKFLIVGLGNIGPEYADTRHNVGFMVADQMAAHAKVSFESGRFAFIANYKHKGKAIYLIKPTTYMNLSGKAVNYWMKDLKVPLENTLVIVDDLALPFGKLRLRPQGSSAGHNGLKSVEEVLETANYPRLRFGIGNDYPKGRQAEYVLSPFLKEEFATLGLHLDKAEQMIHAFTDTGIARTMSLFND
jgi:PTH1 family peptidyl-tRNA hydrolase